MVFGLAIDPHARRSQWEYMPESELIDCISCRSKGMKAIYRFRVLKVGKRDLYRGKAIYLVGVHN